MELIYFSEKSVDFHWTTGSYIPEAGCENLKPYNVNAIKMSSQ
jgi:hypothetical protein